jgi:hypothetical protein
MLAALGPHLALAANELEMAPQLTGIAQNGLGNGARSATSLKD